MELGMDFQNKCQIQSQPSQAYLSDFIDKIEIIR